MIELAVFMSAVITVVLIALCTWRWLDRKEDDATWARLASLQLPAPDTFDASMVNNLPPPTQRMFRFMIKPGTPLYTVAEISMQGEFSLGSKDKPNTMPMRAEQVLAAPHGFVWKLQAGRGAMRISGSDAAEGGNSWSRFWLLGVVPVARAGGNTDHALSAFGRYVAEAVFWTPAALLPGDNVRWESIDDSTARVILRHEGMEQAVDITIDSDGKPTQVVFERWSDANPEKVFQRQAFGGYLSEYAEFNGFRLPTKIEAGNFFGSSAYFPFYKISVTDVQFPATAQSLGPALASPPSKHWPRSKPWERAR